MGLSDPFSTTYQGSFDAGQSLGQGIQSAAGSVADVMKQKQALAQQAKQRKASFDMLKGMGLIQEDTTPPSVDDLKTGLKVAGKTMGKDVHFNMADDLDEGQQKNFLTSLYKSFNIPIPQGKTKTTISPGVSMDLGGGTTYTSPKQEKTIAQQVQDVNDAQKLLDSTPGMGNKTVSSNKSGISIKSGTGAVKDVQGTAKTIVEGIKNGNLPPTLTGMARTAGLSAAIEVEAENQGFNLKQAQVDYTALNQLTKTMNQNQMVQLNTAFNSVQNDIKPMRDISSQLERTGFKPANSLIIKGDLNGVSLSPDVPEDQVKDAVKYVTQVNLMRDNMAVAFMRGGVPTDQAFKLTDNIMNPAYSNDQIGAALDQVEINLNLRKKAVGDNPPYVPGQQNNATQTMNAIPGMNVNKSSQSMDMSKMTDEQLKAIINGQ